MQKQHKNKKIDEVGMIMAFEDGSLDKEDTLKLFQHLVDTGRAWHLQGSYGRMSQRLLDAGLIHYPKKHTLESGKDYYGNRIPTQKEAEEKR